nr:exonuclease 1 [Onthophagus taurus]
MGISGLLPFLENASEKAHVSKFRGCTAGIDAYCWLHKGAFGCAEKLAKGEDTNGYVLYCMKYIKMLQSYKVRPILVFDGQHLPAKRLTEEKRRNNRRSLKHKAAEMLRLGNVLEARKYLSQSIDVTHKMALNLIKECREKGIDCIVAPYEADAQLAYLNISKIVDFVISEDSDLTLFGCNQILFKMDINGNGVLVNADKLNDCMKLRSDKFSFDKFRYMCILSGCDYLDNLPGVGLKKALKFISVTENPSIYNALSQISSYLKLSNVTVTDEYRENFMIADATFQYQIIFDPKERRLKPLNPISPNVDLKHCVNAGSKIDDAVAFQLSLGNLDPFTHKQVDDWDPDSSSLPTFSIWLKNNMFQTMIKTSKDPIIVTPKKIKRKAPLEKEIVVDEEHEEDIMVMYKKMGPFKSPVIKKSEDIDVLIHGEIKMTSVNRCSSGFNKNGPTVVDYKNGLSSRFFKKNDETNKNENNHEPMVSLLGAIDNLIKRRSDEIIAVDKNETKDDQKISPIITRKRRNDFENESNVKDNLDKRKCEEKVPTSKVTPKQTQRVVSKRIIKKQTSILTFFSK